ncbi:MAG: anaerobic sulfatase maturase [Candidatus Hydrogenedentes bacterium]|nr:anaerobic sulfatase maturase [Candidatus Hydrogenedentota bacterium]
MPNCRQFQLLIKPVGADCNLHCDYCFYLRAGELYETKGRHIMPDDVLERVISGLLQLRFPQTVFAWQGGEPTLAGLDFFRTVIELEKKHGAPGQGVGNAIQTNGVLLNEDWCALFRDYKFLVGLSIDGPPEIHNRRRHDHARRGNWDKAMAAARLMDRYQVPYNILCVVNSDNVYLGAELLRWFTDQGFNYLQFIPCLEPGMPYNVPVGAYGDFLCDTFDYWAGDGFGRVSIRDFDSLLATRLGEPSGLCTYGRVCNHYIVIEHNGDVYPCDFFVFRDWKLGNVMEAPLESFLETEKYRQFAYQKDKVPECRGCRWRSLCHGGCQKDRVSSGSLTEPTAFCEAYKKFFAHAVPRLNALAKRTQGARV